jgi:small nuclear ribonucleoprotein (snRNP)-like protein
MKKWSHIKILVSTKGRFAVKAKALDKSYDDTLNILMDDSEELRKIKQENKK